MTDADVPTDGIITSTRRQWSRQISIGATLESCFLHFPLQIESILMNNARWSMCSEISQESYCALNGWQARTLLLRIICDSLQHIWLVWNVNWKTALPSLEITSAIILYLKFWQGVVSCGKKKEDIIKLCLTLSTLRIDELLCIRVESFGQLIPLGNGARKATPHSTMPHKNSLFGPTYHSLCKCYC